MYTKNRNLLNVHFLFSILLASSFYGCSAFINAPTGKELSTLGEVTPYTSKLKSLPDPNEKVVVAVYKFKDQTGQYKASDNNANWSTAIPQGTTSILLKALEDSKWFTTIERENISDLLNERQIIKSTRQEYAAIQNPADPKANNTILPPLLFAGIIIEGGIISYDTNIMTGGAGARYFGVGGSTQYRQDRISVYLRAVSTNNGKILKTVYTSKTILSQSLNGNFFRYIDPDRLMEAEIGITKNEPVHLAVKEAIEKAVYSLIIEGAKEKLWTPKAENVQAFNALTTTFEKEDSINNYRVDNTILQPRRGRFAVNGHANGYIFKGDFGESETKIGYNIGAKFFINKSINLNASFSNFSLENKQVFKQNFNSVDLNAEFIFLPDDNFSPYLYGGIGFISPTQHDVNQLKPKVNAGIGIEYLPINSIGIRAFGEYGFGLNDDWEGYIGGKRKDNLIVFGVGANFYFGKKFNN